MIVPFGADEIYLERLLHSPIEMVLPRGKKSEVVPSRDFFLMTELNEAGDDANKSGNDDEDKSLSKKLVPPKVCNSLPRAPLIKRLCLIRSSESPDIHKSENFVMN